MSLFVCFVKCSLTQVIRKFAKQLDEWLKVALHDLPENLRNIKFECMCKYVLLNIRKNILKPFLNKYVLFSVSRRFSQILKRQTSLNHLCQVQQFYVKYVALFLRLLFSFMFTQMFTIRHSAVWNLNDILALAGLSNRDPQCRHHLSDAWGLEERRP